ncbi:MAG: hypothetical protein H2058_07790 [Muricauda sp.]|nr:hypothetical protein [Allomuricauda sp.]MBA4745145.1 hypothetical protein [Allomuricauda sp.]
MGTSMVAAVITYPKEILNPDGMGSIRNKKEPPSNTTTQNNLFHLDLTSLKIKWMTKQHIRA